MTRHWPGDGLLNELKKSLSERMLAADLVSGTGKLDAALSRRLVGHGVPRLAAIYLDNVKPVALVNRKERRA